MPMHRTYCPNELAPQPFKYTVDNGILRIFDEETGGQKVSLTETGIGQSVSEEFVQRVLSAQYCELTCARGFDCSLERLSVCNLKPRPHTP